MPRWLAGEIDARAAGRLAGDDDAPAAKEDGRLDWQRPADELARQVRAYTPWPGAFTTWEGRMLKVLRATGADHGARSSYAPGTCFIPPDRAVLAVACGQGALALEVIQLEGKRAMPAAEVAARLSGARQRPLGVA